MVEVTRGDLVLVAFPGGYGKVRPAVIVQADAFTESFGSVIACPFTSISGEDEVARVSVVATNSNGLEIDSTIMVEKIAAVPRNKIARVIGHLDDKTVARLDQSLAALLGLA